MMNDIQQEPIQLRTPMTLRPEAKTFMERHGCLVGDGSVMLPLGSKRTQYLQIVTITLWYEITLPDQYQMIEAYDWRRAISILYVPPEER